MNPSPEFARLMANVLAAVVTGCMCAVVVVATVAAARWFL